MAYVRRTFSLDPVQDAKILDWLDKQPNASLAVRDVLRAFVDARGDPVLEVLAAVDALRERLERKLDGMQLMAGSAPADQDVPGTDRAAANLERLGL